MVPFLHHNYLSGGTMKPSKLILVLWASLTLLSGCSESSEQVESAVSASSAVTDFRLSKPLISGDRKSFSISANVYFASTDSQKRGGVFIAAGLTSGDFYFLSSSKQWNKFDGTTPPEAYFSGKLTDMTLKIAEGVDVSDPLFNDAKIYIGYGLDTGSVSSFQEMANKNRYLELYIIK